MAGQSNMQKKRYLSTEIMRIYGESMCPAANIPMRYTPLFSLDSLTQIIWDFLSRATVCWTVLLIRQCVQVPKSNTSDQSGHYTTFFLSTKTSYSIVSLFSKNLWIFLTPTPIPSFSKTQTLVWANSTFPISWTRSLLQ